MKTWLIPLLVGFATYGVIYLLFGSEGTGYFIMGLCALIAIWELILAVSRSIIWILATKKFETMPDDIRDVAWDSLMSMVKRSYENHFQIEKQKVWYFGFPVLMACAMAMNGYLTFAGMYIVSFFINTGILECLHDDVDEWLHNDEAPTDTKGEE